jgi:hypothetical protein
MAIYYLYETCNLINGKIYIGVHSTNKEDDNYLGSGTLLTRAVQKYGKEKFIKTILEYFDSEEAMYAREAEIVDKNFVLNENNYNISLGGVGGWTKSNQVIARKRLTDSEWTKQTSQNISNGVKKAIAAGKCKCATKEFNKIRTEKSRTLEAIEKRKKTYADRNHQQGVNHSLYGRKAVHRTDIGWIWVNIDDIQSYINDGWIKGKGNQLKAIYNGN